MIEIMHSQDEKGPGKENKRGTRVPSLEIITILLVFLGTVSLISLLLAPQRLNAQGILNIVTIAAFPIAYGIWMRKKWAFYATLIFIEPLLLIYPLIAAFSPHFGIEYNWISFVSFVIVCLSVVPILISNENYGEILKGTKLQTVIKKLPVFNALFIVFGVALIIRTVLPYDTVFKDTVRFASDDAVFHMRLVENALFGNHFPSRPFFDAYTFFPHGTSLHFAPLFEQIIIFATWIISLGAPTRAVMEAVGAYYPAILGALVVFPVYIIGRELYNKYVGLIAAVLVAMLPGQLLSRSIIGFTDHHIAEALLGTIAVMFLILALKRAKGELSEGDILNRLAKSPREWMKSKNFPFLCYVGIILLLFQLMPWALWVFISFILFLLAPIIFTFWQKPDSYLFYACLAGMALGFYLLTWIAGLFFVFVLFAYGIIHYTINGLRRERNEYICIALIPIFLISLLMILPFLGYPFPYDIRHVGSLSIGLITFSTPFLYRHLITKFGYMHDVVSEKGVKAEAHKLPQKIENEYFCPICGKKSKGVGIVEHIKTKHSGDSETKVNRKKIKLFFDEHPELSAVKKSGIETMRGYSPLEKISRYDFLLPLFTAIVFLGLSVVFFPSIIGSFGILTPGETALTVAEIHPMDLGTAWIWFTTPFFISFFAMAILAMNIAVRNRPEELLLLVWSIIMFVAVGGLGALGIEGIGQNRFAYYYAVNAAILTGLFAAFVFEFLTGITGKEKKEESTMRNQSSGKKGGKPKRSESTFDLQFILFALAIMIIAIIGLVQIGIESLIPLVIIVAIFFLWWYAANTKRASIERPLSKALAILLIMVIVFYPFPLNAVADPFPSVSNLPLSAVYAINTAERGIGAEENWYEALRWMRNNTPEPGVDYYALYEVPPLNETTGKREDYNYPSSAYGVMSWWDYGHMITWIAHRIPNANPFQQGIGGPIGSDNPGACVFFIAKNEADANEVADALGVRYVVSDFMMADAWNALYNKFGAMTVWAGDTGGYYAQVQTEEGPRVVPSAKYFSTIEARLHIFDGTGVALTEDFYLEPLRHYRLIHESPSTIIAIGGQEIKFVKVFEYVNGATIQGSAPADSIVEVATNVTTNQGREFVYSERMMSNSTYEFIVPYSTEGPIEGGTNFDVFAAPYKIRAGHLDLETGTIMWDIEAEVSVPEEAVMEGRTISVELLA